MPYNVIFAATDFLNNDSGGFKSILKLIGLIILCALIIAASYFTTKFIGKKQIGGKNYNFKSIDVFRVTPNKFLQIVKIGERYFCIAVTKEQISLICEMKKEDIKYFPPEVSEKKFKDIITDMVNKKNKEENTEISDSDKEKE